MSRIRPLEWWNKKKIVLIFIHSWEWIGLDWISGFQAWYQPKYKTTVHYTHKSYKLVWILIQKIVENMWIWEITKCGCILHRVHLVQSMPKATMTMEKESQLLCLLGDSRGSARVSSAEQTCWAGIFPWDTSQIMSHQRSTKWKMNRVPQ